MFEQALFLLADFSNPENIGTNPQSLLLLLPIVAAISIVYKATKMSKITFASFVKETALLFLSIMVFMVVTALVLTGVAWIILE